MQQAPPPFVYRALLGGIRMHAEVLGRNTIAQRRGGGGGEGTAAIPPPLLNTELTDSYQL